MTDQQSISIIGAPGQDGLPGLAVVKDHDLIDFYTDPDMPLRFGDIFYARVDRVMPGLRGMFVTLNGNLDGFLPFSRYSRDLSAGDMVSVQVVTEPQSGNQIDNNDKLARLSQNIVLRGRYFVLFPKNDPRLSFSKRMPDHVKQSLGAVISNMDLPCHTVCRRAGGLAFEQGIDRQELVDELNYHRRAVEKITLAKKKSQSPIGRILSAQNRLAQAIVDYADFDLRHIDLHAEMDLDLPPMLNDMKDAIIIHDKKMDVFDHFDLWSALNNYNDRRIELTDGVTITVDDTAVGLIIDVDSAGDISPLAANQTAMDGVFCMARIRNAGGMILVDGINMDKADNRRWVQSACDLAAADPAQAKVHGVTRLGLMEITRQQRFAGGLNDFLR